MTLLGHSAILTRLRWAWLYAGFLLSRLIKRSFRFAQTRFSKTSRAGILLTACINNGMTSGWRNFLKEKESGLQVRQGTTTPLGRNPKASRQREELLDCQPPNPKHNSVLLHQGRAGHSNTRYNRRETPKDQGRLSHIKKYCIIKHATSR